MIDLILDFARWPLNKNRDLGMEVFLADTENAETLPRGKVLDFLQGIDRKLAVQVGECGASMAILGVCSAIRSRPHGFTLAVCPLFASLLVKEHDADSSTIVSRASHSRA